MRYFYDFEFLDTGREVLPISVGVVADDGREFYAVWSDALDFCSMDKWLWENVAPHLPLQQDDQRKLDWSFGSVRHPNNIRKALHDFFLSAEDENEPVELWGWFVAYDHLCLSQIWGKMNDVPAPIPQFSNDIRSLVSWYGIKKYPSQTSGHHNALADARHNKVVFDYIMKEIGND